MGQNSHFLESAQITVSVGAVLGSRRGRRLWLVWRSLASCTLASTLCFTACRMTLEAIRYSDGRLEILNQLLLPSRTEYERVRSVEDAWTAIREMKVLTI